MDFEELYKRIALEEGVSPQEIREQMQEAIMEAWKNPLQDGSMTKALQAQVTCKGEVPTPEEVISYAVLEILQNRNYP